jgi:hypothetical protein
MNDIHIEVFLQTTDLSLIEDALRDLSVQDIEVSEWMLKSGQFKSILITISSTIALNLVSSWIYNKVIDQTNQPTVINQTVINGNQISGHTVTINEINQMIIYKQDSKPGNDESAQ